jgi:deazaflavin-dependent oxidoreductase (nitroreductase family)
MTPRAPARARPPGPPAFVNRLLLAVLRSPLHRLAGRGLLALTVTGRRTRRPIRLPVQHAADGDRLVIVAAGASRKHWWRNLIGGAPVTVDRHGRRLAVRGRIAEGAEAAAALAVWTRHHPKAAPGLADDVAVVVIDQLHPGPGA